MCTAIECYCSFLHNKITQKHKYYILSIINSLVFHFFFFAIYHLWVTIKETITVCTVYSLFLIINFWFIICCLSLIKVIDIIYYELFTICWSKYDDYFYLLFINVTNAILLFMYYLRD